MKDQDKAKEQLISELAKMRQRVAELETADTERLSARQAGKRVEEEIRWRAETLTALHETTLNLAARRALPDLLETIVARAVDLLSAKGGGIYLYRPTTDDLEFVFEYNLEPGFTGAVLKRGEGLSGKVLETGQPMAVADYGRWEGRAAQYEGGDFTADFGELSRAVVAVPISWGDRLLGVLNVLDDAPRTFSSADVALLERFTPLAAAALEQTRLLEEERARRGEAETLRQAVAAVAETLSLDERLKRILEQLARVVPYDSATVQLLRDGYLEIVGGRGFREPEAVIGLKFPVAGHNLNMAVVVGRKPVILSDARAAYPDFQEPPHNHIRSWLGLPLIVRDQVIGMLAVDSIELEHFNEEHARLITPFANQVAVAIENARLYEAEQQRAQELEASYEQLQKTQEALVKAERLAAMSQIGVTVRHEINNPLTAVLGNAQFLLASDQTLSAESREILKEIEAAAIRIRDVVRKLDEIEDRLVPYLGQTMMIDIHNDREQ